MQWICTEFTLICIQSKQKLQSNKTKQYIDINHSLRKQYIMAQQPNQYFGSVIRNSYGFQDQTVSRPNVPIKTFQPYNSSSQQQNKPVPNSKNIESRGDGIEALGKQKKNFINQSNSKPVSGSNTQSNNTFQVYEPVKFSSGFSTNSASLTTGEERGGQLRGSCPNIFKKLDHLGPNLRSTTQFVNMGKWGLNNNYANDPNRKQSSNQQAQTKVPRVMKKHNLPFVNDEKPLQMPQSTKHLNMESLISNKAQIFNANKSLSSGQLPSFRYNFNPTLNKSNIKNTSNDVKQTLQKSINSPTKNAINRTPMKFSKINNIGENVRSPDAMSKINQNSLSASIATELNPTNVIGATETQTKKFKSLHQIWEIKEKQKTQKRISQGIKSNFLPKSKIINGFQIGKVLGKGKFGEVYLARHQSTGFVAAIKKIVKSKVKEYKMIDQFSKQIKLHNALDHPNIVKFYGFFEQNDDIYLVMEYMNGGTLFDYLNEVYHLGVKETIEFLRDIIEAIVYLHEKSIAHRDIKPQNIVISSQGVAKLCDFGWSAIIETSRRTYCGTFDYAPPQILERKNYDMSVDVWCIGVLTYELLTGRVPFEGDKRNQIMQKIVNVDKNKIQYPIDIPKQAKEFIELLVQKDPNLRPKPSELLKHPFFSLCPPKVKSKKLQ